MRGTQPSAVHSVLVREQLDLLCRAGGFSRSKPSVRSNIKKPPKRVCSRNQPGRSVVIPADWLLGGQILFCEHVLVVQDAQ